MSVGSLPWYFYRHQWSILPPAPKGNHLDGQTVIITGANSGVGLAATAQLAALSPARLILAVRSVEASEKVAARLKAKYPRTDFQVWSLDLLSFDSIKAFASRAEGLGRLDVLINNAGINPNFSDKPMQVSKDGYERVLQTNVLAPLLTTLLLAPLLRQSATQGHEPKVIFTGSDVHTMADPKPFNEAIAAGRPIVEFFNDKATYVNATRYVDSKLMLQMLTRTLVTALPGLTVVNVSPGLCHTNLGREFEIHFSPKTVYLVLWLVANARSASTGARNLSTAVVNAKESCDYWSECKVAYSECTYLTTATGMRAQRIVYTQLVAEMEKIVPGCTSVLDKP